MTMSSILDFTLFYFHFWRALMFTMLKMVVFNAGRKIFYYETIDETIMECLMNMFFQSLSIWIIHIIITQVGMIFVEAEVLRTGNEQVLDNLEEGVIIQNKDTHKVVFINKAAKRMESNAV